MIGSVGPNVSSVMIAIVWSTSVSTVGSKNWPGPSAASRRQHLRALVDRVLHVISLVSI